MFKNEYQGGAVVDVFSAHGKDPVAKWKLHGQASISKLFDKEMKGFVYSLEGNSQTHRMQIPKDGKTPLVLIQKFLVLQVNVPYGKDFSAELVVTDQGHLKRRLYLSTVHKEFSSTPLHARIPLICLQRNIWCNLCIDLGSFTTELFRGAMFLSLDGIIISACCKVRRIFTMKSEPADHVDKDPSGTSNAPKEEIPKSCQFPAEVQHITQLMNMARLRAADMSSISISSDSEQLTTGRATRGSKSQDCSHIAFGSKVTGHPPLTARKNSSLATGTEHSTLSGGSGRLKVQAPTEQASSERIGSGRPKQMLRKEKTVRSHTYSPETMLKSSEFQSPSDLPPKFPLLENCNNSTMKTSTPLSLEEDEEDDVEEIFSQPKVAVESFSSDLAADDLGWEGGRKEACLEDDFVGSEGEEDQSSFGFPSQRFVAHTSSASPILRPASISTSNSSPRFYSEPAKASTVTHSSAQSCLEGSRKAEIVCVAPTRCLSPCTAKLQSRQEHFRPEQNMPARAMWTSINRTSVREIPLEDVKLHKVRESMRRMTVGSSTCDLFKRAEQKKNEEEELRMLVSIKRQQEEEEGETGLSESQKSEQGQYYQKEANPLLPPNPREFIDVFSPPITHPRQQQTECKGDYSNPSAKDATLMLLHSGSMSEETICVDKFLSLIYDSCLNCYFDPQTEKYYELI